MHTKYQETFLTNLKEVHVMNMRGKSSIQLVLLGVLCAAVLAACGAASDTRNLYSTPAMSTATPVGISNCAGCHSTPTKEWLGTKHANLNPINLTNLSYAGSPSRAAFNASAPCANCHDPLGDSDRLSTVGLGNAGVNRPVVGCESCHGNGSNHYGSGPIGPASAAANNLPAGAANVGETVAASAWFNTCTSCHELLAAGAALNRAVPVHDPNAAANAFAASNNPMTASQIITDTHFATPMNYASKNGTSSTAITGYAMDYSSETVCADCHVMHSGDIDINIEWASSAHTITAVGPWNRYNWTCNNGSTNREICGAANINDPTTVINNRSCGQRCHTTTGYIAFNTAIKDKQYAEAVAIQAGLNGPLSTQLKWKPEMLQCKGCHTDTKGTIRNPGAYNATYLWWVRPAQDFWHVETTLARSTFQYPDLSNSNVCVLCHSERQVGSVIKNLPNLFVSSTDVSAVNGIVFAGGHARPAAAVMFKAVGYEFGGRDYDNPASYKHSLIGSTAVSNTGTSGPCVGCHMYRANGKANHGFEAVGHSGANVIAVVSEVCYNCHANSSGGLAAVTEGERLSYYAARNALKNMIGATNVVTGMSTSTVKWLTPGDTDTTGETTGKNNMGAFFNYQTLSVDGGAYIHNSKYTKRLIYDAIDWLDDGVLNYSAGNTLRGNAAVNGSAATNNMAGMGAINYLLPVGVNPYKPGERP